MEMSGQFPVQHLCRVLDVNRSGFYKWKKRLEHPSDRLKSIVSNVMLFKEYHSKYPSHGYRWLNAKIRLDTGLKVSDQYAHKICKTAGIVSVSKHYRYKKPGISVIVPEEKITYFNKIDIGIFLLVLEVCLKKHNFSYQRKTYVDNNTVEEMALIAKYQLKSKIM